MYLYHLVSIDLESSRSCNSLHYKSLQQSIKDWIQLKSPYGNDRDTCKLAFFFRAKFHQRANLCIRNDMLSLKPHQQSRRRMATKEDVAAFSFPPMFMNCEIGANTLIGEFWGSCWASSLPLHLIILHINNPFVYLAQIRISSLPQKHDLRLISLYSVPL